MSASNPYKVTLWHGLSIEGQQGPINLPRSVKCRALLAYLLLTPNGASRASLATMLFPQTQDPKASFRWALAQLRRHLVDPKVITEGPLSRLAVDFAWVDCDLLKMPVWLEQLEQGVADELAAIVSFLMTVQGAPLAELQLDRCSDYEMWRLGQENQLLQGYHKLAQAVVEQSEDATTRISLARQLVAVDGHNEDAWSLLIGELNRAGESREAQRTYDQATLMFEREGLPVGFELGAALQPKTNRLNVVPKLPHHRERLAVLPIRLSESGGQDALLIAAINESLYAAASASRSCVILARSVTRDALSHTADAQAAGRKLGADLLLDAIVSASHNRCRITLELITVGSGVCLFNWQHDVEATTTDDIADSVLRHFSARFEIDLQLALIALAYQKPESQRSLWDYYYLALPRIYTAEGHDPVESLALLQNVIDQEPSMGTAVGLASWVRSTHPQFNELPQDIAVTAKMARRAIELCQDDTFVMGLVSVVLAGAERTLETPLDIVKRALSFNPYSTMGLCSLGILEHYLGRHEVALGHFSQAESAIDTEPLTFMIHCYRACCYYMLGEPSQGLLWARKACGRNPSFVVAMRIHSACLAALGKREEARSVAAQMQRVDPSEHLAFYRRQLAYQRPEDIERLLADLSKAGVREDGAAVVSSS